MYKVIIDLPKVNDSLTIKFSLMLVGTGRNQQEQPVYSKFTIGGVDYLKFSPHPFVTLDFNPKKKRNEEVDRIVIGRCGMHVCVYGGGLLCAEN